MKTRINNIFILFVVFVLAVIGCQNDEETITSPANKFIGKYESQQSILVRIQNDFCTSDIQDVATIYWDVKWEVTETSDPNIIDIKMTYISHGFAIINSECTFGAGYLPEPSPLYIKGYVDGDKLSIQYAGEEFGTFNFIDYEFEGTMSYSYCLGFCQKIYTDDKNFSVQKL